MSVKDEIQKLKREKNAVILAHYYVKDEVQDIADDIGDSYYLSKKAAETNADIIVFCGVSFMGESAKILNPRKKVLMPDASADCAMAHMVTMKKIEEVRAQYNDLAVVCYINSTAEIKTVSDVCVTSSNAVKIVKQLPNHNIFFVPDENLGRYVAEQVPGKNIILNHGYCPIHAVLTKKAVTQARLAHPNAPLLAHPECTKEVLEEADYIGSTSGIIAYVGESSCSEFLIATEVGVFCKMKKQNPEKKFYPLAEEQICWDMKKVTLEKVAEVLKTEQNEIRISEEVRQKALRPLERMLELAK